MITPFNRKELLVTFDMKVQSEVRTILQDYKIDYDIKVTNRLSPSPLSAGLRAYAGSLGTDLSKDEYKIYVKKDEYDRAIELVRQLGSIHI